MGFIRRHIPAIVSISLVVAGHLAWMNVQFDEAIVKKEDRKSLFPLFDAIVYFLPDALKRTTTPSEEKKSEN